MRFVPLIFSIILSLFLSACASMVDVDYDRNINFKSFDSYLVQTKPERVTSDTRINTPFMQQRIVAAINTSLDKKGLTKTNNNSIVVKYYLDVRQDFETDESAVYVGLGSYSHHSAVGFGFNFPLGETYSVDKLVLTIDMVSTKTNQLLWRGSLASQLSRATTPESNSKMVNALVDEILENFPPK